MSRHEQGGDTAAITDLLGLRVICPFLEDLEIIENLIKSGFSVVELERKGSRHSWGSSAMTRFMS
jgi:putative GTP pyrophosphokinase